VCSEVYIGHWPREAVKEQNEGAQARTNDPRQPLMVYGQPVAAGVVDKPITTPDGRPVKVIAPQLDITDPSMKAAVDQYKYTLVNGVRLGRWHTKMDGGKEFMPTPSFLIQVPQQAPGAATPQPAVPDLPNVLPEQPSTPGADRLKSIGG